MQVKQLMTPNPITIGPERPAAEALKLMYQHDIRRLPVIENRLLVGILSDRDIKQVLGRPALSPRQTEDQLDLPVRELMTRNPITVPPDAEVKRAIELAIEHKISGRPVVDLEHRLVGILSEIDLLRYALDLIDRMESK